MYDQQKISQCHFDSTRELLALLPYKGFFEEDRVTYSKDDFTSFLHKVKKVTPLVAALREKKERFDLAPRPLAIAGQSRHTGAQFINNPGVDFYYGEVNLQNVPHGKGVRVSEGQLWLQEGWFR
jgi:hypothetical protein